MKLSILTFFNAFIALFSASSFEKPKFLGPNITSSKTVGINNWSSGSWKTNPTVLRILLMFCSLYKKLLILIFSSRFPRIPFK